MRSRNRLHLLPSGAIALMGGLLIPGAAGAQSGAGRTQAAPDGPSVAMPVPRDTVRVSWLETGRGVVRLEGVVLEAGSDMIRLDTSDGVETIPTHAITLVEFGHSRTPWEGFKRGFQVGALAGGLGGVVAGAVIGAGCQGDSYCPGPAGGAAIIGVVFGLGGGMVGGVIKGNRPGVEWRDAPVRATAGLAPGGGTELGIRVSF